MPSRILQSVHSLLTHPTDSHDITFRYPGRQKYIHQHHSRVHAPLVPSVGKSVKRKSTLVHYRLYNLGEYVIEHGFNIFHLHDWQDINEYSTFASDSIHRTHRWPMRTAAKELPSPTASA